MFDKVSTTCGEIVYFDIIGGTIITNGSISQVVRMLANLKI
jgi:hypothetical protein